jgi:Thioredoxin-like
MYPHERSLVKRMEGRPFALIGVNSDNDRKALKKVLENERITWRSFWNGGSLNGPISREWNVQGWPTLYLIDRSGVIRAKYDRTPKEQILDTTIERLVMEAEKKT